VSKQLNSSPKDSLQLKRDDSKGDDIPVAASRGKCDKHDEFVLLLADLKSKASTSDEKVGDMKESDLQMWKAIAALRHDLQEVNTKIEDRLPPKWIMGLQQALFVAASVAIVGLVISFIWRVLTGLT
jgi:hypothetical protein